jgi:hypothetical protein
MDLWFNKNPKPDTLTATTVPVTTAEVALLIYGLHLEVTIGSSEFLVAHSHQKDATFLRPIF